MGNKTVEVALPEELVASLASRIGPGQTLGDVIRETLQAGQYFGQIAASPDEKLLVQRQGKFFEVTLPSKTSA